MKEHVWINKRLVETKKARISIFDRGFLYGDGVFETMRSYAGVVFKLDEHIGRLYSSLKRLKIKTPYAKDYLKEAIYRTISSNALKGAYVRLAVTRGEGRFGIGYKDDFTPNVVIVAKDFQGYPEWMHKRGLAARVIKFWQNEHSPLSSVKSQNYLGGILARFYAKEKGADEAILTNTCGMVTEAATSNIFLVKGNRIITPSTDSGILLGITRGVIVAIARRLKFKIEERLVPYRELFSSDEIFLTNSLAEVLPVIRIDRRAVGSGRPGDVTKLLHISYQKEVIRSIQPL